MDDLPKPERSTVKALKALKRDHGELVQRFNVLTVQLFNGVVDGDSCVEIENSSGSRD
jgi:hypothetical protein